MDKKVYILMPVYNVEKVLSKCLDSIINQTYTNWELILVDDGSTDKSGEICDRYSEKDYRIRVIHQKNQGSSKARRTAINAMTDIDDTFVTFVDSDDILPYNAIRLMYDIAVEHDCDIVSGEMIKFLSFKSPDLHSCDTVDNLKLYDNAETLKKLFVCYFGYGEFSVSLCSKLFKTDFFVRHFSEIKNEPYYFGDDLFVTIRMIPAVKKMATIDNMVYYYRPGGGTNRFIKTFVDDSIILYHTKKEFAEKYNVGKYYASLIDIEMKNLVMSYLIMCVRSKTFPHGKLEDEIRYILDIPEFRNAICSIREETLKIDYSEFPGFTQALVSSDIDKIKQIVMAKAKENKIKRFIKNLL